LHYNALQNLTRWLALAHPQVKAWFTIAELSRRFVFPRVAQKTLAKR
jgi:hypothetical protein